MKSFGFVILLYDDMELEILDQAIEAYLADTLDNEAWQEMIALVQKVIS